MKILFVALSLFLLLSCGGKNAGSSQQTDLDETTPKSFPMITIPNLLIDPGARASYLVEHYWDLFNFADTSYIDIKEVAKQAFVNYAQMLAMKDFIPYDKAVTFIHSMLDKAGADSAMYHYMTGLYKKYFYQGNSPMMDDEFYIPVLEHMLQSPHITASSKTSIRLDLQRIRRNRPGQLAEDFGYTLFSGKTYRLFEIKADYTLIFFNNLDCPACKNVQDQIFASPVLSELIRQNRLKVLALYPDRDLAAWKNNHEQIPSTWINAYDKDLLINLNELYDLKAIPMLYLLDAQKRVLLKDCRVHQVEQLLEPAVH